MASFFIIQSRDPFTDARARADYELIHHLVVAGNKVTVLLVQNGVMPARRGSMTRKFDMLCAARVNMLVDRLSLRQREIEVGELKAGILLAQLDEVIKAMLAGEKVIWH